MHGTHVAAIIGATAGNGYSMAGIASNALILPIRVLGASGEGTAVTVADGIRYAVDSGAKVINLSLGAREYSEYLEQAIEYAHAHGALCVAAAGNDGQGELSYPARSPLVLAVGATDKNDELASFSNYGAGLSVVAPGEEIPSLLNDGNVAYASGTSMAAPHVSAAAALVYSLRAGATPEYVKGIIEKSTIDLGRPGYDPQYGYGRIDLGRIISTLKGGGKLLLLGPDGKQASRITLQVGETWTVVPQVKYTDGSSETLAAGECKWTSSNSKVAIVTDGVIKAVGKGRATITAVYGRERATISVSVTPVVEGLTLSESGPLTLTSGERGRVKAIAHFNDGSEDDGSREATWESSDPNVATVEAGTITARAQGTATVTASCSGQSATLEVKVIPRIDSLVLLGPDDR